MSTDLLTAAKRYATAVVAQDRAAIMLARYDEPSDETHEAGAAVVARFDAERRRAGEVHRDACDELSEAEDALHRAALVVSGVDPEMAS